MSLTSELKRRDSAATRFMREHFSQTSLILRELRAQEQARPLLEAPGLCPPADYSLVGTAFDYRLRYLFAETPFQALVAWRGVGSAIGAASPGVFSGPHGALLPFVHAFGGMLPGERLDPSTAYLDAPSSHVALDGNTAKAFPWLAAIAAFHNGLAELLRSVRPIGRRLDGMGDRDLCRYCAVLALFEQCFRARATIAWPIVAALFRRECTLDTLLALVPAPVIDDLTALAATAHDVFSSRSNGSFILNPIFDGSPDVGGADADLILGGYLFEIKATKTPLEAQALYQALGYVLLDYSDQYAIRGIGIYFARRGLLVEWPLQELLDRLSNEGAVPLPQLRERFRSAVAADTPSPL